MDFRVHHVVATAQTDDERNVLVLRLPRDKLSLSEVSTPSVECSDDDFLFLKTC